MLHSHVCVVLHITTGTCRTLRMEACNMYLSAVKLFIRHWEFTNYELGTTGYPEYLSSKLTQKAEKIIYPQEVENCFVISNIMAI